MSPVWVVSPDVLLPAGPRAVWIAPAGALTRLAEDHRQALEAELPALDRRREAVQDA